MTNQDFTLFGLLTANISIDAIAKVIQSLLPVLNAAAVIIQIGVGVFTLCYAYNKWEHYRKETVAEETKKDKKA